jgi:hypothetical protein
MLQDVAESYSLPLKLQYNTATTPVLFVGFF